MYVACNKCAQDRRRLQGAAVPLANQLFVFFPFIFVLLLCSEFPCTHRGGRCRVQHLKGGGSQALRSRPGAQHGLPARCAAAPATACPLVAEAPSPSLGCPGTTVVRRWTGCLGPCRSNDAFRPPYSGGQQQSHLATATSCYASACPAGRTATANQSCPLVDPMPLSDVELRCRNNANGLRAGRQMRRRRSRLCAAETEACGRAHRRSDPEASFTLPAC